MIAVVTGASSGLGRDMARELSKLGYDIIAVGRNEKELLKLKNELNTNTEIVCADLSDKEECIKLAKRAAEADVLINNAGYGVFGDISSTSLDDELGMIDLNVSAVHILTKLFLKEFEKKNSGYILNVASLAAFFPGPLFGAYYATKSYVLRLSQAAYTELKAKKSKVHISVLCPGPVHTGFAERAKVNFGNGTEKLGNLVVFESKTVAKYTIKQLFKKKAVIIPGFILKTSVFMRHFLSDKIIAKAVYFIQSKKCVIK